VAHIRRNSTRWSKKRDRETEPGLTGLLRRVFSNCQIALNSTHFGRKTETEHSRSPVPRVPDLEASGDPLLHRVRTLTCDVTHGRYSPVKQITSRIP
jgi:hypothetical protein